MPMHIALCDEFILFVDNLSAEIRDSYQDGVLNFYCVLFDADGEIVKYVDCKDFFDALEKAKEWVGNE